MQIEIGAVGDEVLMGLHANTNAAFLSQNLTQKGYKVARHFAVGDERNAIRRCVQEALERASLVILTGGLGPTIDDVTASSVQGLFKTEPTRLTNEVGSAEGFFYFTTGRGLILLPGVPREMEAMFERAAWPLIEKHFALPQTHSYSFSLCFFKEMEIDPFLRDLQAEHPEIECGIYPSMGTLRVVLRSKKPLEEIGKRFEERFPTYVFHKANIQTAVHGELMRQKQTLALAESCTGGAIAASLALIPDASYFLLGSLVVYSNEWKEEFLSVRAKTLQSSGAVSRETVDEMLQGLFARTRCDYAIAVSGIAGPSGGTLEKPIGTIYIGVGKRGERSDIGQLHIKTDRRGAIDFSVQIALSALWRRLAHNTLSFS